jgi:anti-anti-sigma factor
LVAADTRGVVLDLSNVRFLSTPIVSAMLMLRREAENAGIEVVLGQLRPELDRVFRIRRLDRLFSRFDSCESAIQHFKGLPADETSAA